MRNQWGQDIQAGDVVAYTNRTGSYTERKLGVVIEFGERRTDFGSNPENTVFVSWVWDGSYGSPEKHPHKGTVGLKRVFQIDPASLDRFVLEGLQDAAADLPHLPSPHHIQQGRK
jgi:hypothetical protein